MNSTLICIFDVFVTISCLEKATICICKLAVNICIYSIDDYYYYLYREKKKEVRE